MAMETLYTLADYDIVSNVVENNLTSYANMPSFYFDNTLTPYLLKDMTRSHNEVYKMYIKSPDIDNISFMVLFGCDDIGNGYAVHLNGLYINVVEIVNYVVTDTISSRKHNRQTSNDAWFYIQIQIVNKKVKVYLNHEMAIVSSFSNFIPVGNYFGYRCAVSAQSVNVYVSDTTHHTDQILWGNINVNGDGLHNAESALFEESTFSFIINDYCDEYGDWAIFVDEDATDQTRHILLGIVNTDRNIQSKGILGITI